MERWNNFVREHFCIRKPSGILISYKFLENISNKSFDSIVWRNNMIPRLNTRTNTKLFYPFQLYTINFQIIKFGIKLYAVRCNIVFNFDNVNRKILIDIIWNFIIYQHSPSDIKVLLLIKNNKNDVTFLISYFKLSSNSIFLNSKLILMC